MLQIGTVLQNRFLIEQQLAQGGMGAVYLATDQKFGSRVAIKERIYEHAELADAFEREARILNTLHHPILPHVSDYFSEPGGHFLVMEYIEGEDLSEKLREEGSFPVPVVTGWAMELLEGLDYLHSQDPPIIHRDIKPGNLKLTTRGNIVLLDFGLAKETSVSGPGVRSVFGYSRRYSPFEQIEGAGTDVRSDIFSLGATLFHLITGEAPVDVLARASAIVAGHPDPLRSVREIRPEVPEGIAHVLQKALALDPERRFHSAEEMRSAITTALEEDRGRAESTAAAGVTYSDRESLPVSAAPAGASYANTTLTEIDDEPAPHRAHNRVRRAPIGRYPPWLEHRAFLSAVAIIALLGIGYSIIWFSRSSNTDNTVLQQPQAAANVRSEPSVQEARPTISPDISEVAVDLDHDGDRGASTMRPKTEAGVAPSSKRREVRNGTTDRQRVAAQTRRGKDARRGRPVYEPPVSAIETIFTGIPPHERRLHQRVYPN